MTEAAEAAPCRHASAVPASVVDRVAELVQTLAADQETLARAGLSSDEYARALPAAIETLRGRTSADNGRRRDFLASIFYELRRQGLIDSFTIPQYGNETVYRLEVPDLGSVAVIQKGCPDGVHSSVLWQEPSWAIETYLWWLCSSKKAHPGEHVARGVSRLRRRFFSDSPGTLSGVVFHNDLCGTQERLCPKQAQAINIDGQMVPPPCVWAMPMSRKTESASWNWERNAEPRFPRVLLAAFSIDATSTPSFTSQIGFRQRSDGTVSTVISNNAGPALSSTHRT